MKSELQLQKLEMHAAISWLNVIELCDLNIAAGNYVELHKEKRQTAIEGYATAMESILDSAITISNRKFREVA